MVTETHHGGIRKKSSEYVFCLAAANVTGSLCGHRTTEGLLPPLADFSADHRWKQATWDFDGKQQNAGDRRQRRPRCRPWLVLLPVPLLVMAEDGLPSFPLEAAAMDGSISIIAACRSLSRLRSYPAAENPPWWSLECFLRSKLLFISIFLDLYFWIFKIDF